MGFRGDLLPRMATSMVISPIGWDITPLSTVIILYYYVYIYIYVYYIYILYILYIIYIYIPTYDWNGNLQII